MPIELILAGLGGLASSPVILALIRFARARLERRDSREVTDDDRQALRLQAIETRRENELSESRQELRNRVVQLEQRVGILEVDLESARESSTEARLLVAQYRAELMACQTTCRTLEIELKRTLDRIEVLTPKPPIAGGAEGGE